MDSEADGTERAETKGHTTDCNSPHEFYKSDLMTDTKITTSLILKTIVFKVIRMSVGLEKSTQD